MAGSKLKKKKKKKRPTALATGGAFSSAKLYKQRLGGWIGVPNTAIAVKKKERKKNERKKKEREKERNIEKKKEWKKERKKNLRKRKGKRKKYRKREIIFSVRNTVTVKISDHWQKASF